MPKPKLVPARGNELTLFDRRPVVVGGFRFEARAISPVGRPSAQGWQEALIFAGESHDAAPFWIGGLVAFAEDRHEWKDKLDQMMSVTHLERHTLHNYASMYRRLCDEAKQIAPSPTHAEAVAKLEPSEQVRWLKKARKEGWTRGALRVNVRAAERRKVIDGQAVLEGRYRVVLADPPWLYGDRQPSGSSAKDHYPGMTIEQLCALPVQAHVTKDAVLFLWVTAPFLLQAPGPREVLAAWGFEYKTGMVWHKRRHNFGHYVAIRHEHVIIATRGSCLPDRPTPMIDSVFTSAQESFEHSEKPEDLRRYIERLYDGPYLELFARRRAEGWVSWGNDPCAWAAETEKAAV